MRLLKKALTKVSFESLELRRLYSATSGVVTPGAFAVAATSPTSVKFDWSDTSTAETRFRYESATSADFGMNRTTATVPANSIMAALSGLMPGKFYYVRVRAENGPDVSDYATLTLTMPAAALTGEPGQAGVQESFGKPTNVAMSEVTATTAKLSWQDNASAENRYRIMRSTTPNFDRDLWMVTPAANATSATLTGLEAGKTYYVRVRAENGPNVSQWGDVVTVTPLLTQPPAVATGLKVYDMFNVAGTLKVTWADNAANETGYVLERSATADFASAVAIDLPANTTEYTDAGLPTWRVYHYRVKAVNTTGASATSNSDWNRTAESEIRSVSVADPGSADGWAAVADTAVEGGIYLSDGNANKGAVSYSFWTSDIYAKVEIKYHSTAGSASNVPIYIRYDDLSPTVIYLDQRTGGDQWVSLGLLAPAYITIGNDDTDGTVTLDAVRVTEIAAPSIVDFGNSGNGYGSNGLTVVTNDPALISGDYVVAREYPDDGGGPFYYINAEYAANAGSGRYEVYIRYAEHDDSSVPTGKWVKTGGDITVAWWVNVRELYIDVPRNGPQFAIDAVLLRFVYSDF